jgi:hypothetical protein
MHDQDPLDVLLARLDPDRMRAGQRYETLRRTLVKFFELRQHADADVLADRAIDLVSRRLADGLDIDSVELFSLGVARRLDHDLRRSPKARQVTLEDVGELTDPGGTPESALALGEAEQQQARERKRMLHRLRQLPSDIQLLLIEYYRGGGRTRIQRRRQLAAERGGNLNSLRIAVCRIRAGLTVGSETGPPSDPSEGDA